MRLLPTFLVLFYWLICVTNGAPPREAIKKSNFGAPYTHEEDQFIVNELQDILEQDIKPQSKTVWHKVAAKHHEKKIQGSAGFLYERSASSLRNRFLQALANKKRGKIANVPEALVQKFNEKVSRHPYTKEEDNFIIEELSKPCYTHVFTRPTYEALLAEHTKKRNAKIAGFQNAVRTVGSIRNHLAAMKNAGQFPKEVMEKIHTSERIATKLTVTATKGTVKDTYNNPSLKKRSKVLGASSSQPTSNQPTDIQVINEGEHNEDWIADMIEELQNNTDFEVDFSKLE